MPSSGGNQQYDEAARSGVGDGDALAAGTENIRSFAPIENAPFLNSHEQTLYDVFDEMYDEPVHCAASAARGATAGT
jgi:protein-glutamine gamma-glutamyltransferase